MSQSQHEKAIWVFLLLSGGGGFLIGNALGGDRARSSAIDWAIRTTAKCEQSLSVNGFENVTECLESEATVAEEERKAFLQEDGPAIIRP